jgi:hypothetical protein
LSEGAESASSSSSFLLAAANAQSASYFSLLDADPDERGATFPGSGGGAGAGAGAGGFLGARSCRDFARLTLRLLLVERRAATRAAFCDVPSLDGVPGLERFAAILRAEVSAAVEALACGGACDGGYALAL